ncbi:hypothetical protein BO70DRAFT_361992 [Aspergillus heteromorphus CBS 117.55]|uniref:Uncharacterized protein n=1 Tax=Aspergillus heteromorphus CBS 117.55 TaxID=1448321 RepID=A0A317W5W4_9EURO|nr:uncharacterized protein BO70DRAFT_361992 [Aspergillus heteromorphus CBS 117.55]PWY81996.1 hypothetical protein BO70DRAFT_361992 [Aspergillus heteromorphus CBS 117.55]
MAGLIYCVRSTIIRETGRHDRSLDYHTGSYRAVPPTAAQPFSVFIVVVFSSLVSSLVSSLLRLQPRSFPPHGQIAAMPPRRRTAAACLFCREKKVIPFQLTRSPTAPLTNPVGVR